MRLLVLLLYLCTVNLVVCKENYYKFTLEVLLPDLQAIEQYMTKNPAGTIQAIIRWPDGISFEIRKSNEFLKISGRFFTRKEYIFAYTGFHDKLSFKDGSFYMKHPYDSSAHTPAHFSSDRTVYFRKDSENDPKPSIVSRARKAEKMPKPDRYLYISYFDLDEIRNMIEPNMEKLRSLGDGEPPRTFLAITKKPYPYFVEYTMNRPLEYHYGFAPSRIENRCKLRVLVGERGPYRVQSFLPMYLGGYNRPDESNKLSISSKEVSDLDFDPRYDGTLKASGLYLSAEEVFGVRMASTGFLADVDSSGVRMLSSSDLTVGSRIPTEHKISCGELLKILKNVEPSLPDGKRKKDVPLNRRPNNIDFQVMGHVLTKKMKLLDDGKLDESCPLSIEYKYAGPYFSYRDGAAQEICTDDSVLWVRPAGGRPSHFIEGDIILKYH